MTLSRATALGLFGALLAGAGVFLPWITVTATFASASRSGLELGGDSLLILGAAVLAGVLHVVGRWTWLAAGLGVAIGLLAGLDLLELQKRESAEAVLASVGPGIYLCIVGAVLLVVAAIAPGTSPAPDRPSPQRPAA